MAALECLFGFRKEVHVEVIFSRRLLIILVLLLLGLAALYFALPRLTGRSLPQVAGLDSGRQVAAAGTQAFFSVDYQTGPDRWAARLCALSSQPACEFYQNTVAPAIWSPFVANQTVVEAEVEPVRLISDLPGRGKKGSTRPNLAGGCQPVPALAAGRWQYFFPGLCRDRA